MSRRRLTRQQKARIAAIREKRLHQAQNGADKLARHDETPRFGIVVVRHGRSLVIADAERHLVNCQFRQNLGDIVCGDNVIWHSTDDGDGVVSAVRERSSLLSRPDYGGHEKPLAANLTQLVVVAAPSPPPTGYLLDQYLAAAEQFGLRTILVINKSDLLDGDDEQFLDRRARSADFSLGTTQHQLVAARDEPDVREGRFDVTEVTIPVAEKLQHQIVAGYAKRKLSH